MEITPELIDVFRQIVREELAAKINLLTPIEIAENQQLPAAVAEQNKEFERERMAQVWVGEKLSDKDFIDDLDDQYRQVQLELERKAREELAIKDREEMYRRRMNASQ